MDKISRRAAFGSVAATALVHLGTKAEAKTIEPSASSTPDGSSMSLDEFRQMKPHVAVEDLFRQIDGHTFTMCHLAMKEQHGVWIPELIPVFKKMDAMRAAHDQQV